MSEIQTALRDPKVIVSLLAICVTVAVFLVGQWWWRRKALTYSASVTRLLSVHESVRSRVQILLDGTTAAEDVSLVVVTLRNSGHEPIKTADFERPLRIDCGERAEILTLELVETRPPDLKPELKLEGADSSGTAGSWSFPLWSGGAAGAAAHTVVVTPLLLNKGDSLKLKALVNRMGAITVNGRIAGVKEIKRTDNDVQDNVGNFILAGVFGTALSIAQIPIVLERVRHEAPPISVLSTVFSWNILAATAVAASGIFFANRVNHKRARKRWQHAQALRARAKFYG